MRKAVKARLFNWLTLRMAGVSHKFELQRPVVSFTFDDAPVSAALTAAPMLEKYGAAGTFYLNGKLLGTNGPSWPHVSRGQVRQLHLKGHEIACHTLSHPSLQEVSTKQLSRELQANNALIQDIIPGLHMENFAYPYGDMLFIHNGLLKQRFRSCRGIFPALNVASVNIFHLNAMPLVDIHMSPDAMSCLLDEAVQRKAWLIFYTHDVVESPSEFGCTPQLMQQAVDGAMARHFDILPITKALDLIGIPRLQSLL